MDTFFLPTSGEVQEYMRTHIACDLRQAQKALTKQKLLRFLSSHYDISDVRYALKFVIEQML